MILRVSLLRGLERVDKADEQQREQKFQRIEKEYKKLEAEFRKTKGNVFDTNKGIFGTAKCTRIFEFFKRISIEGFRKFIDLGSGDGGGVLIASLLMEAAGIDGGE